MGSTNARPRTMNASRQVMDARGDTWLDDWCVEHRNTAYPHAHILVWSKSLVSQAERMRMYQQVKVLEHQRDHERHYPTQHHDGGRNHDGEPDA